MNSKEQIELICDILNKYQSATKTAEILKVSRQWIYKVIEKYLEVEQPKKYKIREDLNWKNEANR